MATKLRKGDKVIVITGKDVGKRGVILDVLVSAQKVVVEDVNTITRHTKPTDKSKGGLIKKPAPIHWSNVRLLCPETDVPTGVSFVTVDADKKKVKKRKAKASSEVF